MMKNILNLGLLLLCFLITSAFTHLDDDVSNNVISSTELRISASSRDYETVLKFLDQKQIDEMTENNLFVLGKVLINASVEGKKDVVQALIEKVLDVDTQECGYYPHGQYVPYMCGTPLVAASYYNHIEIVWHLIEQGADVNARQHSDTSGETALIAATRANNVRIADILLRVGADVTLEVGDDTALTIAKKNRHYVIERLINHTAAIRDFLDCSEDWIPFNCF